MTSVSFTTCTFHNTSATDKGGLFSTKNLGFLKLSSSKISLAHSKQGKIAQSTSTASANSSTLYLSKNTFECFDEYFYEYLVSSTKYNMSKEGSAFLIDSVNVNSDNNEYRYCSDAVSGGVFYINRGLLTDTNSQFTSKFLR